jgi:hypothetical protein
MHRCKTLEIMRNEANFLYAGIAHHSRCAFFNSPHIAQRMPVMVTRLTPS